MLEKLALGEERQKKHCIHTREGRSVAVTNGPGHGHWPGREDSHIQRAGEVDMQDDLDMDRNTAVLLEAVVVHMEPRWVAAEGDGSS